MHSYFLMSTDILKRSYDLNSVPTLIFTSKIYDSKNLKITRKIYKNFLPVFQFNLFKIKFIISLVNINTS